MRAREYWERKLGLRARSTQENYRRYFDRFLGFAGLSAEELYFMQKSAVEAEDPRDADVVVDLVGDFLASLEGGGYSNETCNMVLRALRSFFSANKLGFDVGDLRRRSVSLGKQRVKKVQILEVYRYCQREMKQRNRALVMVAKDSGLRISDISQLRVEQYRDAREVWGGGERFLVFEPFRTVKTGDYAHTILGPESVREVDDYLGDRRRGPLFLGEDGGRFGEHAMSEQFRRLSNALGRDGAAITAHSYRRFFKTMMEEVMPEAWVKLLMGKSVGPYSVPGEKLAESYVRGYNQLRIFSAGVDREEFEAMKRRLESLESMAAARLGRYTVREEREGGEI